MAIIRVPRERMVGSALASSLCHEVGHQGAALLDLMGSLQPELSRLRDERPDRMRARLTRNVARFRGVLESRELKAMGGLFPVQTLDAGVSVDASTLHARLGAAGVRVVLRDDSRISLLITARHSTSEIDKRNNASMASFWDS